MAKKKEPELTQEEVDSILKEAEEGKLPTMIYENPNMTPEEEEEIRKLISKLI